MESINQNFSYTTWLQGTNTQTPVTAKETASFFQNLMSSFNTAMGQANDAAKRESYQFKQIYNDSDG